MATWTPWGTAERVEKVERGISVVDTAGHGGYRVSTKKLQKASRETGIGYHCTHTDENYTWFEEDCEWGFVALLFPNNFKSEMLEEAKKVVERNWPELYTTAVVTVV